MAYLSLTNLAHELLMPHLRSGDVVVDATLGNGHDAAFLAAAVAPDGWLYGFDVQSAAIAATQDNLAAYRHTAQRPLLADNRICLLQRDHREVAAVIDPAHQGQIQAAMFNLGYLPGRSEGVRTTAESTAAAVLAIASIARPSAVISIISYRAHPGGFEEYQRLQALTREAIITDRFRVTEHFCSPSPQSPVLFFFEP